jgi:hypothetical protein
MRLLRCSGGSALVVASLPASGDEARLLNDKFMEAVVLLDKQTSLLSETIERLNN